MPLVVWESEVISVQLTREQHGSLSLTVYDEINPQLYWKFGVADVFMYPTPAELRRVAAAMVRAAEAAESRQKVDTTEEALT